MEPEYLFCALALLSIWLASKCFADDRVARQTPPFMAGKDSADSNAVVKSDCL